MSRPLVLALVSLAGGLGSALRLLVDSAVPAAVRERYPWGITLVNVSGSFALGLVVGVAAATPWATVVAVGLLGGYTTFSAANAETLRLLEERRSVAALASSVGQLGTCVAAAAIGIVLGSS